MSVTEPSIADIGIAASLRDRFVEMRRQTIALAYPLSAEDQVAQSMPDASPTKWHLGHSTWFFETFVVNHPDNERSGWFDDQFSYLFNSYYNTVGERQPRAERGLLTRPRRERVLAYREHVEELVVELLDGSPTKEQLGLVELGIHHEQQHQELILMDAQHLLSRHPFPTPYVESPRVASTERDQSWTKVARGIYEIGHDDDGFCFDNEGPRHQTILNEFEIADRPVTCGEWKAFIDDGGYDTPTLWLSDGWAMCQSDNWQRPIYWGDEGLAFNLHGVFEVDPNEPVSHVSYFEADAFARWAEARLPTEAEWEVRARQLGPDEVAKGHYREGDTFHPVGPTGTDTAMFGTLWEWTASPYSPYPGFQAAPGAVGEYNGKFMNNQYVLRGGCHMTPPGHTRVTYRNFFPPHTRWQASGIRLAR